MEKYKTYKHINNKDVAFYVTFSFDTDETVTVNGTWVNVVTKPFIIDRDTITIKKEDVENWKEYDVDISKIV